MQGAELCCGTPRHPEHPAGGVVVIDSCFCILGQTQLWLKGEQVWTAAALQDSPVPPQSGLLGKQAGNWVFLGR